ncbi:MAG TPA: hypothetical protein DCM49_00895, partial [Lachnospiraceae bacterium]|nr:hypothetical protein [Lachnospiraceae bacterium]
MAENKELNTNTEKQNPEKGSPEKENPEKTGEEKAPEKAAPKKKKKNIIQVFHPQNARSKEVKNYRRQGQGG